MPMSQIVVIAKIPCQPRQARRGRRRPSSRLDHVEGEEGTRYYVLLQDATDENVLWMYEVYADQASFDAHYGQRGDEGLGARPRTLLGRGARADLPTPLGGKGL
jgi:quinol monooxygenase YgiN